MSDVTPSVSPGAHPQAVSVNWTFAPPVARLAYSVNTLPPVVSEYIAYDLNTPPKPFIAVTQDGTGNVVYDGGFPKFYNNQRAAGATTFAQLNAAGKYLHNTIKFIANPAKVAAGNNKILVLGDADTGGNYVISGTGVNDFKLTFDEVFAIAGFVPTYKTKSFYGTQINCTLAELEAYCGVILVSSVYTTTALISNTAVTDLISYRKNGNGLFVITDHGQVIPNIEAAHPVTAASFFATANKLIVNFGAYFSGDFNRVPVNVGHIRSTYGDHPLYNGMTNEENIYAGGSESQVFVQVYPTITPNEMPTINVSQNGLNKINFLLLRNDNSMTTTTLVYYIGQGNLALFKDAVGNPLSVLQLDYNYRGKPIVTLDGTDIGTLIGELRLNDKSIGSVEWEAGTGAKVKWWIGTANQPQLKNGDVLQIVLTSPFTYIVNLPVVRNQPPATDLDSLAAWVKTTRSYVPTAYPNGVLRELYSVLKPFHVGFPTNLPKDSASLVGMYHRYFNNRLSGMEYTRYSYTDQTALLNALATVPPTAVWSISDITNNKVYGYKLGQGWLEVPGVTNHDIYGAPAIINEYGGSRKWRLNVDGTITQLA